MPTVDDAYTQLWVAINPTVTLNPGSGFYQAWRDHYAEWGSPVADEFTADDGTPWQTFAHAIVYWGSDGPHVQGQ